MHPAPRGITEPVFWIFERGRVVRSFKKAGKGGENHSFTPGFFSWIDPIAQDTTKIPPETIHA
jgi:hypothetical protein